MADPQRPTTPVPAGPPGYNIRPPATQQAPAPVPPQAPSQAAPPQPPSASQQPSTSFAPPREPVLIGGLTQNGAVIGAAVILGLLIVFVFLRSAVRNHLIANKASLSSANGASWAFFAFMSVVATTVVFGLIGQLWTVLPFVVPLGLLMLITLLLFIMLFKSATRVTR